MVDFQVKYAVLRQETRIFALCCGKMLHHFQILPHCLKTKKIMKIFPGSATFKDATLLRHQEASRLLLQQKCSLAADGLAFGFVISAL